MSVSAISSISYDLSARPVRGIGVAQPFSIAKSPLRADSTKSVSGSDPVADSVELTRDFPTLLVSQPYLTPAHRPLSRPTSAAGETDLDAGDERRSVADEDDVESSLAGTESPEEGEDGEEEKSRVGEAVDAQGRPLDEGEQRQVDGLKARDREVRAHEQAHKAAGGQYAGAISYDYRRGPDGKRYAVGGEVSIDVSPEKDPKATIAKMRQVRAAAMAPAEPSGQDRSVAAQAAQLESEARREMRIERAESAGEDNGANTSDTSARSDGVSTASDENNGGAGAAVSARLSALPQHGGAAAAAAGTFRHVGGAFGYTPIDVFA